MWEFGESYIEINFNNMKNMFYRCDKLPGNIKNQITDGIQKWLYKEEI